MGDRTYCKFTINKHYYDQNKEAFDAMDCDEKEEDGDEVSFVDYEANYGSMESYESFCHEHQIEYDRSWEAGGDYSAGTEYARNVNGEYKLHDIYDDGEAVLNELKAVMAEKDPVKREALLEKRIRELEPFEITPLKVPQSIDFIKNA